MSSAKIQVWIKRGPTFTQEKKGIRVVTTLILPEDQTLLLMTKTNKTIPHIVSWKYDEAPEYAKILFSLAIMINKTISSDILSRNRGSIWEKDYYTLMVDKNFFKIHGAGDAYK